MTPDCSNSKVRFLNIFLAPVSALECAKWNSDQAVDADGLHRILLEETIRQPRAVHNFASRVLAVQYHRQVQEVCSVSCRPVRSPCKCDETWALTLFCCFWRSSVPLLQVLETIGQDLPLDAPAGHRDRDAITTHRSSPLPAARCASAEPIRPNAFLFPPAAKPIQTRR